MKAKIMDFEKNRNGTIIIDNIKLPKSLPITKDWSFDIIGEANNFIKNKKGIYCNLEFFDDISENIKEGFPCIGVSTDNSIDVKKDDKGTITITKSELMQISICPTSSYKDVKKIKELMKE